jgi:hypothetical protein
MRRRPPAPTLPSWALLIALGCVCSCGGGTAVSGDASVPGTDAARADTGADAAGPGADGDGSEPPGLALELYEGPAVHVRADHTGPEEGTAANPFRTIQAGVDAATGEGPVRVAAGTYDEVVTLPEDRGVRLVGAYDAAFAARSLTAHPTRVRGVPGAPVVSLVFRGGAGQDASGLLDGFEVEGGQRGVYVANEQYGGALSFDVLNCRIAGNAGLTGPTDFGGGVFVSGARTRIAGNQIQDNSCGKGGGLMIDARGPGLPFVVEGNVIRGNVAWSDHGGGVYLAGLVGRVSDNVFEDNRVAEAWGWGGGVIVDGGASPDVSADTIVHFARNVYRGNSCPGAGSALFVDEGANVRAEHEIIVANRSPDGGQNGAVYVDGTRGSAAAETVLDHCTIAFNESGDGVGGHAVFAEAESVVRLTNSILWGNRGGADRAPLRAESGAVIEVACTLCEGGCPGSGNLDADPLLVGRDDVHLRSRGGRWDGTDWVIDDAHSPAIDAGCAAAPFDREPAPNGGRANLGAYGDTAEASRSAD